MAKIFHADLYGDRQHKFDVLLANDISTTDWVELHPESPFYLFRPYNTDLLPEYNQGFKITEMMPVNSVAIVTGKDTETIAFSYEEAEELCQKHDINPNKILPILYRTFDQRFIIYDSKVVTRTRPQVMRNMLLGDNLGLITVRQVAEGIFNHVFITNNIVESRITLSNKGMGYLFPLYLYPNKEENQSNLIVEKKANCSEQFLTAIQNKLGYLPTPENIFYYTYAVFHSPTYRQRYAPYLKMDFPRLPLTSNQELFNNLAKIGEKLVKLHLMQSPELSKLITRYEGEGDSLVTQVKYQPKEERVYINKTRYFSGIKPEIWEFKIGGYQVLDKWLKDRKKANRSLNFNDNFHYQKIVVALTQTKELMTEIDQNIGSFPIT